MSSFFITGGLGFIGHNVAKKLIKLGHEVTIYDAELNFFWETDKRNFYRNLIKKELSGAKIILGDIRDSEHLKKSMVSLTPITIIHLAAVPIANLCNNNPQYAIEINLNGILNVLDNILCTPPMALETKFVYISSSFVYGNFINNPAKEDDPAIPIEFYGATKLNGEILTKMYSKKSGLKYVIIRPSAVYGPTDSNGRVSQMFIQNAILKNPLTIDSNGGEVDFTYIEDIAEGIVLASLSPKAENQTFNITTGQGRSPEDFANIINQYIPIDIIKKPSDVIRPKRGSLDITKAKELLGYQPKYTLETGIPEYLKFVKNCGVKL